MKVTPELVARIVETAYAGQADGVDLPTAKNDAISAVFGGGARSGQAVNVNVVQAEGNSEGVKKSWNVRRLRHSIPTSRQTTTPEQLKAKRAHETYSKVWNKQGRPGTFHDFVRQIDPENAKRIIEHDTNKAADLSLRDALVHATDEELAELEAKLTAAESAPHKNGEVTAVEEAVEQLNNRIKF
jgi:hypothetical protein